MAENRKAEEKKVEEKKKGAKDDKKEKEKDDQKLDLTKGIKRKKFSFIRRGKKKKTGKREKKVNI